MRPLSGFVLASCVAGTDPVLRSGILHVADPSSPSCACPADRRAPRRPGAGLRPCRRTERRRRRVLGYRLQPSGHGAVRASRRGHLGCARTLHAAVEHRAGSHRLRAAAANEFPDPAEHPDLWWLRRQRERARTAQRAGQSHRAQRRHAGQRQQPRRRRRHTHAGRHRRRQRPPRGPLRCNALERG